MNKFTNQLASSGEIANGPDAFFKNGFERLVNSPNQSELWWHNMPLPDGSRINGVSEDKDLQFKMWNAMQIASNGGLENKCVLDIGANDGFFSLAALAAGAREVTAMDMDWGTWPKNISYAAEKWHLTPTIVTADFRTYHFRDRYDVIFFLGVFYHLENVFDCMKKLRMILNEKGVIYLESQMSSLQVDVPIFEYSSDIYNTIARQDKASLGKVGISNYLFPNESAIMNLAHSYDFKITSLDGPDNLYTKENPTRRLFKFSKD